MRLAATHVRWSVMRMYSESSVRRYFVRGVISMPIICSTASQYAKSLMSAEQ